MLLLILLINAALLQLIPVGCDHCDSLKEHITVADRPPPERTFTAVAVSDSWTTALVLVVSEVCAFLACPTAPDKLPARVLRRFVFYSS